MSNSSLGLKLNGAISLDKFSAALIELKGLVDALGKDVNPEASAIKWEIAELSRSSAFITVKNANGDPDQAEIVINEFRTLWEAVGKGEGLAYNSTIQNHVMELTRLIGNEVTSIDAIAGSERIHIDRLYTSEDTFKVEMYSYGTIEGDLDTLNNRDSYFTLYDSLFNRAVRCYYDLDHKEDIRLLWGKKVAVTGIITRAIGTGRPTAIRDIASITSCSPRITGSLLAARGLLSELTNQESSELVIGRVRNAFFQR